MFRRWHTVPRRCLRGGELAGLSTQGEWLRKRSYERWLLSEDGLYFTQSPAVIDGEIGTVENFRFITSTNL